MATFLLMSLTLIAEIEPGLDLTQWTQNSCLSSQVVVDFMSTMRQKPLKQFPNIGAAIDAVISSAFTLTQESDFVHLVFDSYIQICL